MVHRFFLRNTFVLLVSLSVTAVCSARDYILTLGGGYAPAGNQISLEKNVEYFERVLDQFYPKGVDHSILFADGSNPARDLQYRSESIGMTQARENVAYIFGQTKYLYDEYRSHNIQDVEGPSTRKAFEQWISQAKQQLKAGDRVLIYVTAHGGKSTDKKKSHNTTIHLWGRQSISMQDFTKQLDQLPATVSIVTVMVQCYAGGFSDFIYKEGDPEKGLSNQARCGFFATTYSRVAAGCTPDINEANYQEYSSYFWSAILGTTRTGKPVPRADYNDDGTVSFAEAHSYALKASTTIDLSVKTSDVLLRKFSKLGDEKHPELMSADTPFSELNEVASPENRVVLTELSKFLKLENSQRDSAAKGLAKQLDDEKKALSKTLGKTSMDRKRLAINLRRAIQDEWPEFNNPWHPRTATILDEESDAVIALLKQHRDYSKFKTLSKEVQKLSKQRFDLDRRWVKCQRLIRCLENVALEQNLALVATSEQQALLARLVAMENQSLGLATTSQASATTRRGFFRRSSGR